MKNVGILLSSLRMFKRMKQDTIANKFGISQGEYSKMENGHRSMTLHEFLKFSTLIRIDPRDLLECIMMAETDAEDAIKRAVKILTNQSVDAFKLEENATPVQVISDFINSKSFPIIRALFHIVGVENIDKLREIMPKNKPKK